MEKKKEICRRCKGEIDLTIDDYCILDDYNKGKFFVRGYYHNKCFNDLISLAYKNVGEMSRNVLGSAMKLIQNVTTTKDDKVIYDIK